MASTLENNTSAINDLLTTINNLPNALTLDTTLTQSGQAADAKVVGDRISEHTNNTSNPHGVTAAQIGAAETSHSHSATEITSGTLPVARGGTGNTSVDTAPTSGSTKMVTSGGVYTALSGKAASTHNQAASTITAGTFAGAVVAQTTSQPPSTSLLRNSKFVSTETTPTNNGEIFWTYE